MSPERRLPFGYLDDIELLFPLPRRGATKPLFLKGFRPDNFTAEEYDALCRGENIVESTIGTYRKTYQFPDFENFEYRRVPVTRLCYVRDISDKN